MSGRDIPQQPENEGRKSHSLVSKIEPKDVHNAYVDLIRYYRAGDFGNLVSDADLKEREEAINSYFSFALEEHYKVLIPYATSVDNLRKISDSNNPSSIKDAREAIAAIGGVINTLILPSDSCGFSANVTAGIFLGKAAETMLPNKDNMPTFSKLEKRKEDNTIMVACP